MESDLPRILFACLQHIGWRPPLSLGDLGEVPGVAFPTRKIAPGLIDGKIVLGTGELNCGNEPERTAIGLLERGLAGEALPSSNVHGATSLGVSLLNQIAFHFTSA
jgi:hypothetical protein